MKSIPQISEAELEVMKILWETGHATSARIIERLSVSTDWKPKTVQTLIARLVSKEAIRGEKINARAFDYYPIVHEQEYKDQAGKSFLQKMYDGSLNLMLASFIRGRKLSREEIDGLKKLLDGEME